MRNENKNEDFKLKYFFIESYKLIVEQFEQINSKNKSIGKKKEANKKKSENVKAEAQKDEINEKKCSMKTAGDVVNRVHWDEKINREYITVGYLDRFLGIKECDFNTFDWGDIVLADLGALAIPEHRIQYFKYKHEVIWDKNQRLDNVYGSTGSNITILDVIKKLEDVVYKKVKVEEEEEEASVGRAVTNPNYFISIPINDDLIRFNFNKLSTDIAESSPEISELLVPVSSLHITLCTMRIDTAEELATVSKVLESIKDKLEECLPINLNFKDFGVFFNKVLHIKCNCEIEKLRKVKDLILDNLRSKNINLAGNYYDFTPHLTVLKITSKFSSKGKDNLNDFIDVNLLERYEDLEFGAQNVTEFQLCKMVNIFSYSTYPVEFGINLKN